MVIIYLIVYLIYLGFSGGSMLKNPPANAGVLGDAGSIPGLGGSPGGGHGSSLQYSCLENPMDRGVWWAMVHGVVESGSAEHTHLSYPSLPTIRLGM